MNTPLYRDVDIYARAVTADGIRFVTNTGFRLGATFEGLRAPKLHMYSRAGREDGNERRKMPRRFTTAIGAARKR